MPKRLPFPCKFVWVSRAFEDALLKENERLRRERGFFLDKTVLSYQLSQDLREGKIFLDPQIMRFRKRDIVKIDNKNIKVQKYRGNL